MTRGAAWVALAAIALGAAPAAAQEPDDGFIGKRPVRLEIDDCPTADPTASTAQLERRAAENFDRSKTLYAQGDYNGAVRELVVAYCLGRAIKQGDASAFYQLLRDIGQAHERNLEYEKAIAYFERYVRAVPPNARKLEACDPEPQVDKQLIERRIIVLQALRARILVETEPKGATVTIGNDSGVAGRGGSGKPFDVPGGQYTMLVELAGHEPHTQPIEVQIGKPFTYFVPLRRLRGRLSAQITPANARVFIRDKTIERFAGIGRVDEELPAGNYVLIADASGRDPEERAIEVLPNRVNRMQIDLPAKPQFGRRQLIMFSGVGASFTVGGLLSAFDNTAISVLGVITGVGAGLVGSWAYLPDAVPLGTSNLTITAGLAGTVAGTTAALVFSDQQRVVAPVQGLVTLVGAGAGYYYGLRTNISTGDAALINSSALWGTAAGGLFALSFGNDDRQISAGLILSGVGVGTVSGVLMSRYYDISRRRTFFIDIGAVVGAIGGLATQSLVYVNADESDEARQEHVANFVLGGLAVGIIGAAILTSNVDVPSIPVRPVVSATPTAGGSSTAIYGISGTW